MPKQRSTRHPNGTRIPGRSVRIPDPRWYKAKDEARNRGETVSAAINRFLDDYGEGKDQYKDEVAA